MSLKEQTVKGAFWSAASTLISKGVLFFTTLILAKLLVPEDFGLVAIATITINFLSTFRDFGIGQAIIFADENRRESYARTAFFLLPASGLIFYILIFVFSGTIASFFSAPEASLILKVMGINVFISSLSVVPMSLLEKDLSFKKRFFPEAVPAFFYIVIAIILAILGLGVWSIVFASIVQISLTSLFYFIVSPWKPRINLDISVAKEILSYGKHLVVGSFVIFAFTNLDNVFVGRILSTTALGFYAFAYNIANFPAVQITHTINKVLFPAYSTIKSEPEKLKSAYLNSLRTISSITLPISALIITLSPNLLVTFYQDKWLGAILPLQILGFYGLIRSLGATTGNIFLATGKPAKIPFYTIIELVIFLITIYPLTTNFGISGAAISVTFSLLIGTIMALTDVQNSLSINYRELLKNQGPTFLSTFVSASIVVWVQKLTFLGNSGILNLVISGFILLASYITLSFIMDRKALFELFALSKVFRGAN